jgi:hypothetical protein
MTTTSMDTTVEPLDPELVRAMYAVAVDRVPSTDAWLGYVRARHPDAIDILAHAAMTDVVLDLLVRSGHLSHADAADQRRSASEPAPHVPAEIWSTIGSVRQMLETLERYAGNRADVVLLDEEDVVRQAS